MNFVEACHEYLSMMLELLGLFESSGANWQTGEFIPVLQHIIIWTASDNSGDIHHPKNQFLREIKSAVLSTVFEQIFQKYPDAQGNIIGRNLIIIYFKNNQVRILNITFAYIFALFDLFRINVFVQISIYLILRLLYMHFEKK